MKELCDVAGSLAAGQGPAEALIPWLRLVGARATVNNGLAVAMAAEDNGASGSLQSCHAMVAAAGTALLLSDDPSPPVCPGKIQ